MRSPLGAAPATISLNFGFSVMAVVSFSDRDLKFLKEGEQLLVYMRRPQTTKSQNRIALCQGGEGATLGKHGYLWL